jgi:hypothetical protein
MEWIPLDQIKPVIGQMYDIWVRDHDGMSAHRRPDYIFVDRVGVDLRPAFQGHAANYCGLYEDSYFLSENLITHYLIVTPPKQ